jgi:hypothetical protein
VLRDNCWHQGSDTHLHHVVLHVQLSNPPLSIPIENVKFGSCSMESDKFITVCETAQSQIAIVDLTAGNTVTRQKISAEAAIMNPLSKVIALRGLFLNV